MVSVGQLTSTQFETSVRNYFHSMWQRCHKRARADHSARRVLFLGYSSGLQMWDCTNLASVSEVLNLSAPSWGHVTFAGVLPPPVVDDGQLNSLWPLIGIM